MKVPVPLSEAFGLPFERLLAEFAAEQGLLPDAESIQSRRFLARAVAPHVKKLSGVFNRVSEAGESASDPYWKQTSNRAHLRLAYLLSFMPCNLFRVASIWPELARLGYRANFSGRLRGIEFGAGPAAGATGAAAGEKFASIGLPSAGDWALIERDQATLKLGAGWAERYFAEQGFLDWGTRTFHRTIDLETQGFLPKTAPKFNLWVMSFFLNEIFERTPIERVASLLMDAWEHHLEDESLIVIVEPALKLQSRKLLELRAKLLQEASRRKSRWFQLLLPCLGHQACGAFAEEEDWCHEEVSWWRPPYLKTLDQMTGLDRKTLPFSYLVVAKSQRARGELLPTLSAALAGADPSSVQRLVSPSHSEGKEVEFFICGLDGKRRARFLPKGAGHPDRGDILIGAEIRGDRHASRIDSVAKILTQSPIE